MFADGADDVNGHRGLETPYQLTDEQVRSMHEDSWAPLPGLLDAETVEKVRQSLLNASERSMLSGPDKKPVPDEFFQHEGVAWRDPDLLAVATSPRLSSAAVGLLKQSEALFCQDISFFKPPGARAISFHQDYSYWPFDRQGCVTLWIALSDMSEEMGPLRYLAGSHHEGPLGLIEPEDIRDTYPRLRDRKVVGGQALKAGDAQAHWELTIHGSQKNEGTSRREAVAFRYIRSDIRYLGLSHPHYDLFNLTPGQKFADSDAFPRVSMAGRV